MGCEDLGLGVGLGGAVAVGPGRSSGRACVRGLKALQWGSAAPGWPAQKVFALISQFTLEGSGWWRVSLWAVPGGAGLQQGSSR